MQSLLHVVAGYVTLALQAVAVVRTFLSYFLYREMEHAAKLRAVSSVGLRAEPSPGGD